MTSALVSVLSKMFANATLEEFAAANPHSWILWEPGAWKPPSGNTTMVAVNVPKDIRIGGEALALALVPRSGKGSQVAVGRSPTGDIEVNDATLSQVHLVFMRGEDGEWTVRDAGSKNGSWLDDAQLKPGVPGKIVDGARIRAGQVHFSFLKPAGMYARVKNWKRMPTPPARTPL